MSDKNGFDVELIKNYPRSSKKINLGVRQYGIAQEESETEDKCQTTYVSPHGIEFQSPTGYPDGTLLKINLNIPDYWSIKSKFVEYNRVDTPRNFPVLARVVKSVELGKRGKKKLILVQTLNIDEVDEQVLKSYLQEVK